MECGGVTVVRDTLKTTFITMVICNVVELHVGKCTR